MDNLDGGMKRLLAIEKSITGMIELHRLVKELKEMEIQHQRIIGDLQGNVKKYRTFLENIPLRLFIKNMDLSYIYCNRSYADDLKKHPEEIAGKTDRDFFPFDQAEKFLEDDKKVLEAGEPENREDQYLLDGREIIVHMLKAPLRDENGTIIGLMGIFWDITQEKHREEEAAKNLAHIESLLSNRTDELEKINQQLQREISEHQRVEERLRRREAICQTIFEGTETALAVLNEEDMVIVEANKKLEEVLGIHREEMESRKGLSEFIAHGDLKRIMKHYLTIRSGSFGIPGGREYRFADKQGNWRDIMVTMALIPSTGMITASFLDVTERKHKEKVSRGRKKGINGRSKVPL
jgi:PAS domain S-box-containing protein